MSMPGPARHPPPIARAAGVLATACALLAPLAVHWFSGKTLAWFDTARLYASERWIVEEALRSFRLPLWNPFVGGGVPLFADAIHGVLHPVSVLTAWLGTDRGIDVLIGGYVACAGLGAAALARELGASRTGAALAAVTYGSSGFTLSMSGNLVFLAGLGSLPFCVAALRRFAAAPRPATLALGMVATVVLVLSGDAETTMVGGGVALALAWETGGWRGAARAASAGVIGVLLAGVQVVPTLVHFTRADRATAGWSATPEVWAFEPWRLPELALPGILGGADPLMDQVYGALAGPGRWPGGGLPFPFAASVFVGLIPLALALAGTLDGRRGRLLAGVALVLLWIAMGPSLGADVVLGWLPIWRSFRYSEKLIGPLTLALAVLAARGLDALADRRVRGRAVLPPSIALGLAAIAIIHRMVHALAPDLAEEGGARLSRASWHVLLAAAALAAWFALRGRLGEGRAKIALGLLGWCGILAAAPAALRPGDPGARLRAAGPVVVAAPPGPRLVTPYSYEPLSVGVEEEWIDRALRDYAANGYVPVNARFRVDSLDDYGALLPARLQLLKSTFGPRWPVAARRYGVTHVILEPPRSDLHRGLHALAVDGGALEGRGTATSEVWAVPHRSWASFPLRVRVVEGEDAALAAVVRSFFDRDDGAVVEGAGWFPAGPGRIIDVRRGLESLRIDAEASTDATLVVADSWWPGWEATLDGRRVPIFRADLLVRAVRWPAGRHVLEMRYRPPEVRRGLFVSILALAAGLLWIAWLRRRDHSARAARCPT